MPEIKVYQCWKQYAQDGSITAQKDLRQDTSWEKLIEWANAHYDMDFSHVDPECKYYFHGVIYCAEGLDGKGYFDIVFREVTVHLPDE